MMRWHERVASVLLVPELTLDGALAGAVELTNLLGFEYCSYTLDTILPLNAPQSLSLNNLDGALLANIEAWRARTVLPPAEHARSSAELMLWPLDDDTELFWLDMRRLGVRGAWSLPASARSAAIGRFTAIRTSGPLAADEHVTELHRWTVLTESMNSVVRRLVEPTMLVDHTIALVRAERDVLAYAADGLTSKQTSRLMHVLPRHVQYLRTQAIGKLGAINLTDAVVKALTLGLLLNPVKPLELP